MCISSATYHSSCSAETPQWTSKPPTPFWPSGRKNMNPKRGCVLLGAAALRPIGRGGVYSLKMTTNLIHAQNEAYRCHCCARTHTHKHCTRNDRRLRWITLTRVNDRVPRKHKHRGGEVRVWLRIHPPFVQAADPLRRRRRVGGRLHCDHLPRPSDGKSCAVMLPEEPSRLSVVVNECKLRLRSLPAPLPRAASHNYRRLLLLLPSSWHADDLCQAALMRFFFFF